MIKANQQRKKKSIWFLPFYLALAVSGVSTPLGAQEAVPLMRPVAPEEGKIRAGPATYVVEVLARYPHDSEAFTQGLLWHEGALIESTGWEGKSGVRQVDLESGAVLIDRPIPEEQFGEGIALWRDVFISLTWRDGVVHRWSADDLAPIASVDDFPHEGWGLTSSEEGLIQSDGSSTLRVLEPDTFVVKRSIEVTLNDCPLPRLNELELIDGLVFANVFNTPYIVAIDPADGEVRKLIDLSSIVDEVAEDRYGAVLNGIAWDAQTRRLFVTGKLWPTLFEIELVATDAPMSRAIP